MVNVYLSGSDARNAAADLWQSDQLKRLNDQFAPPPPADTAQPLPSAPVEAAGDQGSSLPSPPAVGPAMTQPAPPAAVPQPAPVVHPNPTPDRNDLADHFTRNAIADAWEQNAISDVTKGVSQAGVGVQSALADVPKEAQGLVSNFAALPGATAGIPAPQPTQGQVATVAGGQPPTAGSVQAATATTAGISGGGDLSGRIGDRGMQIMASGAQAASWLGGEGQKALQAVLLTEGGLAGARGDQGKSAGPLQFYEGGQLANFAQQMGLGLEQAKQYVEAHPEAAIQWAIGTPDRPGYLGGAIQAGLKAGLTGADLATYAQRHGQVSVSPERAGQNWQSLFGSGQTAVAQGPGTDQQMASAQPVSRSADDWLAIAKEQLGKPYIWGSAGGRSTFDPSAPGFDCSGFVSYVMKKAFGVDLPAFTGTAYTATRPLQEGETPGAAGQVAFYNMGQSDPHLQHIALSIGDGKVIQAGGRRNDVNTDVANDIGTPEWRVPVGIPGKLADAAQQVVGAGAAAAQTGQNVQQAVQQTAQGVIGAVGNIGSAIGTTASSIGGALNSPSLPGQIYQNSPIGAFNTGLQQVGAAAGQIGSALGLQNPLDAAQTYTQVQQKYGGGLQPTPSGGMTWRPPDYSQMTPEDQAAMTNATMAIGGVIGEPGMPKAGGAAARGVPPNEALGPSGPQPGQLPLGTEFGQELPHGGPPPPAGGYEAPNIPQPGQLQLGSELPYGGQPPPAGGYQAPNIPQPGQLQFGSELPLGSPRSSLPPGEALGSAERQPGQMGLGIGEQYQQDLLAPSAGNFERPNVPTPAQTPEQADYLRRVMTYRALTEGTPLPDIPYQGPTAQNLQGAVSGKPSPPTASMRLPGFPNPQTATPLELFRAYHTGNVVSSPATAVHVALNSVISPVWSLGTHSVADLLGGSLNAATGAPTGNLGRAIGRGSAVGSAMAEFGRNLAQGFSEFYANPSNVANKIDNPLASGLLKAQQAVGAALHSSFQNASQAATARLELAAEAGERAWAEGARGQELMNRIGELMTNPTPQMVARAQDVGTRAALRGSAGATQQVMQKIAEIPFIGNTLFPVVRIGAQSIAQGVEKSPLGLVGTGFDVARAAAGKGPYAGAGGFSQVGGAVTPLADRLTNNLAGTALTTFLTFKALDGTITGNGPDDPKARSMLQSQGWQPNSVYVPGRGYMDYHALGPLATPFSIAGNIGDSILYSKPQLGESSGDQVKAATLDLTRRVADYLASGTGMRTIGDMWNLIHGGANAGAVGAQFAGSIAGGFVPLSAAVRAGVSSTDPFQRRAAAGNVQQIIQQELPGGTPLIGGRQDLPIRQDVLGRPEANPQQGIGAVLPRTGTGQPDPMLMLLSRAGIELPATAPKTISYSGRQIQLTPDEQQQRQTLFGQRLQQTLQGYLKSEKFQALPPDQQYKSLEPVVRAASTYADQRMIGEMPAADRKARMATAPRAYGAGVVPYLAAGSNGGLASLIARQSGAEADAAHQRLIAQYSSQPAQPQLAAVS